MIGTKIFAAASSAVVGATAGAVIAPAGPVVVSGLIGPVAIVPVVSGMIVVAIVRYIITSRSKRSLRAYNWAVTLMIMMLAGAISMDHALSLSSSVYLAIGLAALGATVIELAKASAMTVLRSIGQSLVSATSTKDDPPADKP